MEEKVEELEQTQKIEKVEKGSSQFDNLKPRTAIAEMSKEEIKDIKNQIQEQKSETNEKVTTNKNSFIFLIILVVIIIGILYLFPMIKRILH